MIYTWLCKNGHETEVERKLVSIDVPPSKCSDESCDCPAFKRIVVWSKHQSQLVHGGTVPWHDEAYTRLGRPVK